MAKTNELDFSAPILNGVTKSITMKVTVDGAGGDTVENVKLVFDFNGMSINDILENAIGAASLRVAAQGAIRKSFSTPEALRAFLAENGNEIRIDAKHPSKKIERPMKPAEVLAGLLASGMSREDLLAMLSPEGNG